MANYATLDYHITGSQEELKRFDDAITAADKECKFDTWFSVIRKHLGIEGEEPYFRGYVTYHDLEEGCLSMSVEWAWWQDDNFCSWLEQHFPSFEILWIGEEPGEEIYCTNDLEGKHFDTKYKIDWSINNVDDTEYFSKYEQLIEYIKDNIQPALKKDLVLPDTLSELKEYLDGIIEEPEDDNNYISINEYIYCES